MAENKKSFVLYADLKETIEHITDEQAGRLFKHILQYVNDEDPKSDDMIVNVVFTPIKQQLKRDLEKWEDKQGKNSEAGKKSAGKKAFAKWLSSQDLSDMTKEDHQNERAICIKRRKENYGTHMYYYWNEAVTYHEVEVTRLESVATKSTRVKSVENKSTKSTVNVTDTVTVNVNVTDINKRGVFDKWIQYRKDIKKPIKVKATIKALVKKFNETSFEQLDHVVNNSIENTYQGLIWDSYKGEQKKGKIKLSKLSF